MMRRAQYMISSHSQPGQNGGMLDDPRLLACLAAGLLTLTGAGLARFAASPRLGAAALPLALVLGFTLIIGGVQASPRQLGERLPMLALLLLAPALLAAWRPRLALGWVMLAVAALLTGWWMSGGALYGPDLVRAVPVLLLVALSAVLASLGMRGAWQGAILPLGLTAMLLQAAPRGSRVCSTQIDSARRHRAWAAPTPTHARGCLWAVCVCGVHSMLSCLCRLE
jgi:hypothetical protein